MCNNAIERTVFIKNLGIKPIPIKTVKTPCNGCLGCRLDKQTMWTARCDYEAIQGRNAFVTFTYDDLHIHAADRRSPYYSLDFSEFHRFIDNIRHKVKELPAIPEYNRRDFAYFGVGEYGDKFNRPHYHVLFFGLDFEQFNKMFLDTWKNGYIKSLPLLQGGTRYVIDYMTKNLTGEMAVKEYDEKGIERPFYSVSKGLGSELFFSHREEISKTGCLLVGNRWIPAPSYYSSMFSSWNDFPSRIKQREKKQYELELKAKKEGFKSVDDYIYWTSRTNEENLAKKLRNSGKPAFTEIHEFISARDFHNIAHDALEA